DGSSVKRIAAAPQVAVEIVDFDAIAGRLLHLGLRGDAEVAPIETPRFKRLLTKYLGPDASTWNSWFIETIARPEDPDGRFIRLAPTSVFTNNASYFLTGPDLAWPKENP
ncbi:MAG: pyridoxamine 5'-phosphate oxidase, partial [Pseudomonadota bacterium]